MESAVDELYSILHPSPLPPRARILAAARPPMPDPELEHRVAQARTKTHRALELANAAYAYADRKQYALALERMQQARATSPRTVRQRAVDNFQQLFDVAAAMDRVAARLAARECAPLPSIHGLKK